MMHTETSPPGITPVRPLMADLAPSSTPAIIDVEQSFRNAIARYTLLDQTASSLTIDITTLSPNQILVRCEQLSKMQQDLARNDEQLIAILALAGQEIVDANFIKDYRLILAKVIQSCDRIREQASLVKKKLTELLDNTQKS